MNRENFQLWLADLRTTDADQTIGHLSDPAGFCCLGRLCEVAIDAGVDITKTDSYYGPHMLYNGSAATPPSVVREWLDIPPDEWDDIASLGMDLNDNQGCTFPEIADQMEKFV